MSPLPLPRAELESLIYRRLLVECRFALSNIIFRQYSPRYAEYVLDQLQAALDLPGLSETGVRELAGRLLGARPEN